MGRRKKAAEPDAPEVPTYAAGLPWGLPDQFYAHLQAQPKLVATLDEQLRRIRAYQAQGKRQLARGVIAIPDTYLPSLQREAFISALALLGNTSRAAEVAGVTTLDVYKWGRADEEFRVQMRLAEQSFADRIEEAMHRRILSPLATEDRGSAGLTIFSLKAQRPLRYRDAAPFFAPSTPNLELDIAGLANPYSTGGGGAPALPAAPDAGIDTVEGEFQES